MLVDGNYSSNLNLGDIIYHKLVIELYDLVKENSFSSSTEVEIKKFSRVYVTPLNKSIQEFLLRLEYNLNSFWLTRLFVTWPLLATQAPYSPILCTLGTQASFFELEVYDHIRIFAPAGLLP